MDELKAWNLTRISDLSSRALSLVNHGERSLEMTKELIRALVLFDQGKLAKAMSTQNGSSREEALLLVQVLDAMPVIGRNGLLAQHPDITLRKLLQMNEQYLIYKVKGFGKGSLGELKAALARYGLRLGMNENEIVERFGTG